MSYDKPVPNIRASNYYLNNRQKFISFINGLFKPYKKEIEENEKETDENQCPCFSLAVPQRDLASQVSKAPFSTLELAEESCQFE